MDEIIGEYVDRAVTIEMRIAAGLPRGVTHLLYDAARAAQGAPLTWLAAKALHDRVDPGDRVLLVTGAGAWPWLPNGETDGPLGAAAIARAIDLGLGGKPILVAEDRYMAPAIAAFRAAGLVVGDADLFAARSFCAMAVPFPLGTAAGRAEAKRLLAAYAPTAIVFVEKGGPNQHGVFHSMLGTGRTEDTMANVQFLAELAAERGILTIGIGDGGNEIGFGRITEAVRAIQPYGRLCGCPCQGGVATVATTDVLVAAAVSNWGAYGVAAVLAALLRRPEVLHDAETEGRMLLAAVAAGGMDSVYAKPTPMVDGTSAAAQISLITILHEIVGNTLIAYEPPF